MKKILIVIAVLICGIAKAQNDYKITLNGRTSNISLDTNYTLIVNGRKENFRVTLNDTLTYNDNFVRFQYLKDYTVTKVTVDSGILQIMIMSGGVGMIIQEYSSNDPSSFNEAMIKALTKEKLSYGYTLARDDYKKVLKSGDSVLVNKATMTYKEDTDVYEVATFGGKDQGVVVATIDVDSNDENLNQNGRGIIDLMWASLRIK